MKIVDSGTSESKRRRDSAGLRLAFAAARYPPFTGGIELHTEEVARRLAAHGLDVTVLTTDVTGSLPKLEVVDGVEVKRFQAWPRRRDYHFSPGVHSEIRRRHWDLVHVQGFQTLVAPSAMLGALQVGIPYVVTFHAGGYSSTVRKALAPIRDRGLRPLITRADRLVALTEDERDRRAEYLRVPRDRFAVIPNGSDLPVASAMVERDPNLIASIGRLERYKGHHRVIAALPSVLARRPDTKLWIGGGGTFEGSLRALATELGVSASVEFQAIPIQNRQQMADELARVSVVVSMSEFESHPIAVLEALGRGCRAIVARSPGLVPLVEDGSARGLPFESRPEWIADAILDELDRPPQMKTAPLSTWDDCAADLLDVYRAVLLERSTGAVRERARRRPA